MAKLYPIIVSLFLILPVYSLNFVTEQVATNNASYGAYILAGEYSEQRSFGQYQTFHPGRELHLFDYINTIREDRLVQILYSRYLNDVWTVSIIKAFNYGNLDLIDSMNDTGGKYFSRDLKIMYDDQKDVTVYTYHRNSGAGESYTYCTKRDTVHYSTDKYHVIGFKSGGLPSHGYLHKINYLYQFNQRENDSSTASYEAWSERHNGVGKPKDFDSITTAVTSYYNTADQKLSEIQEVTTNYYGEDTILDSTTRAYNRFEYTYTSEGEIAKVVVLTRNSPEEEWAAVAENSYTYTVQNDELLIEESVENSTGPYVYPLRNTYTLQNNDLNSIIMEQYKDDEWQFTDKIDFIYGDPTQSVQTGHYQPGNCIQVHNTGKQINIVLDVNGQSNLSLALYNPAGQCVYAIEDMTVQNGRNVIPVRKGDRLGKGLYIVRAAINDQIISRKVSIVK